MNGKKTLDLKSMGLRIRKRREELKISREKLAEKLDVSVKFISDIEYGLRGISIKRLIVLTQILEVSADYILLGDELPNNRLFINEISKCPQNKRYILLEILADDYFKALNRNKLINTFTSGIELLQSRIQVDIIFSDIDMPRVNGIQTAVDLRKKT